MAENVDTLLLINLTEFSLGWMIGSQEYSFIGKHLDEKGRVAYSGRFGCLRNSRTKVKWHPSVAPYRELSDCKNYILEHGRSALKGEYDDKRSFLNQLDCIIRETLPESLNDPSFFEELCLLLLEVLRDDHPTIRAMCFHVLRMCLFSEKNLVFLLTNHVDIYTVRALDLQVENDMEREEALQLILHIMNVYQNSHLKRLIEFSAAQQDGKKYAFPKSIMQPVIAVALRAVCSTSAREYIASQEKSNAEPAVDRLGIGCLAAFLEFCVLEPELILDMAGTDWMVRILTGASTLGERVSAIVSRILVAWLDQPKLRAKGQLHLVLEQIFAPLIEFGFFQKNLTATEYGERLVESAMNSFSHSFLCILRSWPGLFSCAAIGPNSSAIASSPLRLLEYLGLGTVDDSNLSRIREMIVGICCEFMDLPYASKKFDDWNNALEYYASLAAPDKFTDSLKDDFVLAQVKMFINNDEECARHVDLLSSFRCLAALILINAGILQSLARLIVAQPDSSSGIKATLLLSDVVKAAPCIMPYSWRATILSMPTLVQSACESLAQSSAAAATHGYYDPSQIDRFTFLHSGNAAMILHRFDTLNKCTIVGAASEPACDSHYSLFLNPPKLANLPSSFQYDASSLLPLVIEATNGENGGINWGAMALLISRLSEDSKELGKPFAIDSVLSLLEKMINVISPRNGIHQQWNRDRFPLVVARNTIMSVLKLATTEKRILQVLTKYAEDFASALKDLSSGTDVFSVKNLTDGASMYYFSLIGVMSYHPNGATPLEKSGVLQVFVDLMAPPTNAAYVKVIVSCLDYEHDYCYLSKVILQKALTSTCETARRWCTRFLSALAYRRLPNFAEWGFRLLMGQLGDQSLKVVRHAIRILHKWLPFYRDAVRWLRTAQLDSFGEAGTLLKVHLYADEMLCEQDETGTREAIKFWLETFGQRYVEVIDDEMRDALLSVRRTISGTFCRTSGERPESIAFPAPPHLFNLLCDHELGRRFLYEMDVVDTLISNLSIEDSPLKVKAALMSLGHIGSHSEGVKLLPAMLYPQVVRMAEESPVLTIRGYAFWALNLLSTTPTGAVTLAQFGWESNKHRELFEQVVKKNEEGNDMRQIPSPAISNPQIIVKSARSRSGSESLVLSPTRVRSNSGSFFKFPETPLRPSASLPKLRRTRSATAFYVPVEPKKISYRESEDLQPRFERAITGDSVFTSGLGSLSEDSTEANDSSGATPRSRRNAAVTNPCLLVVRRPTVTLDSVVGEWESRSRACTIEYCLNQGLFATKDNLIFQGAVADMVRDPHQSNSVREKFKLAPLKTRRTLEVNRNLADPAVYVYMSKDEEYSFSRFRREMLADPWLHDELLSRGEKPAISIRTAHTPHIIVLPSDIDVICSNIFPARVIGSDLLTNYTSEAVDELEDRGARSGHSRIQRSDARITHSAYRCFYCSSKEKGEFVLPQDKDVAQLRQEVLDQVDMLEIQQTAPEKRLLMLRRAHPWLFEWPCLYADVLELLDEYRFKSKSRAFLQEIFYNALKI